MIFFGATSLKNNANVNMISRSKNSMLHKLRLFNSLFLSIRLKYIQLIYFPCNGVL